MGGHCNQFAQRNSDHIARNPPANLLPIAGKQNTAHPKADFVAPVFPLRHSRASKIWPSPNCSEANAWADGTAYEWTNVARKALQKHHRHSRVTQSLSNLFAHNPWKFGVHLGCNRAADRVARVLPPDANNRAVGRFESNDAQIGISRYPMRRCDHDGTRNTKPSPRQCRPRPSAAPIDIGIASHVCVLDLHRAWRCQQHSNEQGRRAPDNPGQVTFVDSSEQRLCAICSWREMRMACDQNYGTVRYSVRPRDLAQSVAQPCPDIQQIEGHRHKRVGSGSEYTRIDLKRGLNAAKGLAVAGVSEKFHRPHRRYIFERRKVSRVHQRGDFNAGRVANKTGWLPAGNRASV